MMTSSKKMGDFAFQHLLLKYFSQKHDPLRSHALIFIIAFSYTY